MPSDSRQPPPAGGWRKPQGLLPPAVASEILREFGDGLARVERHLVAAHVEPLTKEVHKLADIVMKLKRIEDERAMEAKLRAKIEARPKWMTYAIEKAITLGVGGLLVLLGLGLKAWLG